MFLKPLADLRFQAIDWFKLLTFVAERLFGKAWREYFVVLYEDSSVIWEDEFTIIPI